MRLSYILSAIIVGVVAGVGLFFPANTGYSVFQTDSVFIPLRTTEDYRSIMTEMMQLRDNLTLEQQQVIDKFRARGMDISSYSPQDLVRIEEFADEIGLDLRKVIEDYDNEGRLPYIISFKDPPLVGKDVGVSSFQARSELKEFHRKAKQQILGSGMLQSADPREYTSYMVTFNGASVRLTDKEYKRVTELPFVESINRDKEVNALLYDSVGQIGADNVWDMLDGSGHNITGQDVTICILDTGIDYTHADLGNCTKGQFLNSNCPKVIDGHDFVNNDTDPMDDHGHGTHCAGTAAGDGVLKGVAPDASLVGYKVLDAGGSGATSDIIAAIERATDPDKDLDTSDHYDIISLSLGGSGDPDDEISTAIDNAVRAGVIAVIAAGNDGPDYRTVSSPGCARSAITVGASCKVSEYGMEYCGEPIAFFSSRGPSYGNNKPDVSAPGVRICAAQWGESSSESQCLDTEHVSMSGTSMATPHVAGACALLLQKFPDWSPGQVKAALKMTADSLNTSPVDEGYGEINITRAVMLPEDQPVAEIWTMDNLEEIS